MPKNLRNKNAREKGVAPQVVVVAAHHLRAVAVPVAIHRLHQVPAARHRPVQAVQMIVTERKRGNGSRKAKNTEKANKRSLESIRRNKV